MTIGKAVARTAAGFFVLVVAAMVWAFASAFARNADYRRDREAIRVGQTAAEVLSRCAHAARKTVEPPTGRPVSCECEYRIFGFARKFVTVQFDKEGRASAIKDWSLD